MGKGASDINFDELRRMMMQHGVKQIVVKELAENDNSKNQVYLGGNLEILNLLPMGKIRKETTKAGNSGLKASLPFSWLRSDGTIITAQHAQLILYPQYPEIRFSGFLRGTQGDHNSLMRKRQSGRLLFFGISPDNHIIGWVADPDCELAKELRALGNLGSTGVLRDIPLLVVDNSREQLLTKLRDIHQRGWLASERLRRGGIVGICKGTNCGGYTLEAQFGIIPNGFAAPDYEGWELKGHAVSAFDKPSSSPITLMTPEPTGGFYKNKGVEAFVRKFGYADKSGVADRINFSSPHRYGVKNEQTKLTLQFIGYRPGDNKFDPSGGFTLADEKGEEAATWHFAGLIEHWKRKHAKAAYVPYRMRRSPAQQYAYGDHVRLGNGTDFLRFLTAMAEGKVLYDPGIKLEGASNARPTVKRRSQFRVKSTEIEALYARMETVVLMS